MAELEVAQEGLELNPITEMLKDLKIVEEG